MSDRWQKVRLGDVAELSGGYAFKSTQYTDKGRFVLRTVNIRDDFSITREGATFISNDEASEYSRFSLYDRDTLFVMVAATLGKVGYVRSDILPALLNQNMWAIRAKPGKIEPDFLQFCFRELSKITLAWVSGSARSFLRRDDVRNLEFSLPPLPEQRAIASVLGALDDKIELNRRMNETLEAMARAIFKDWFVDFGPTRAKMEGRPPYLAPDIWSLFPERLDDEGKPEGWHTGKVSEIGQVVCGKTPSTVVKEYYGNDVPFITIPDMHDKIFALTSSKNLSLLGAASQQKKTLPPGSICVSCIATPGLVVMTTRPSQTNQQINSVIPKNLNESIYWYWVLRDLGEEIRQGGSGGSVLSNLSTGRFMGLVILFASPQARAEYGIFAKPLFDRILQNETENQILATTRDFLLPKLMSGEVRVKDAEKLVGEAV